MAYIEDRIDCLEDRVCKLEKEVEDLKSGIKLNNADIFSRLQHISDRVFGVPKTGGAYKITDGDEPQVQQTTEDFVRVRLGKWEYNAKTGDYKCTECGKRIYGMALEIWSGEIKYCPNCGAKMDEVTE